MHTHPLRLRAIAFLAGIAISLVSALASADPPSRVARLGYTSGAVSFSPAGENDWDEARINRPLTTGDRLWTDRRARAEIQVGGAMIRLDADTGVSILNLDDQITQLQLTQGVLNVRVRRLERGQLFEIDTPNLAFTLRQPGAYRIEVDPDDDATTIIVRSGQGEVYGEDASYLVDSRQAYRFMGSDLRDYDYIDDPRLDDFDRWSSVRDRAYDNSLSARYVSQDVVGYQDLDEHGRWGVDASYGNVWYPNRVSAGWAPYRDGHWAWIDPWGWTWVDDAPWGFAVSHYGRWANLHGTWGWIPGPVRSRAYYAPALVVFVGGANFRLTISSGIFGVAWFPLGPREVYRPAYPVSRRYFENINRSNTVINTTVINNYYTNTNITNIVYVNRAVPGAVVAVPRTAFVQSQPVSRAAVNVSREMIVSGPVAVAPQVAPTQKSVRGAADQGDKPPPRVFERPVVARTAPPAAHAGFAAQQPQLTAKPGRPLDDAARKQLKPVAPVPAPAVKVVAPARIAQPTALPPPATPADRADDRRGRPEPRVQPVVPSPAPVAPAPPVTPRQATPAVPAVPAPETRGKPEPRVQPVVPSPAPATPVPPVTPRQATPAVPAVLAPETRGRPEPRVQPVVPSPAPVAPAPPVTPRQATPVVPAVPAPETRGRPEPRVQPVVPSPAPATPAPPVTPRQATPVVPAVPAPETRGRPEPRVQPVVPSPAPATPAPPVTPRQATPAVPAVPAPETRGRPEPRVQPAAPPRVTPSVPAALPSVPEVAPRGQSSRPAASRQNDRRIERDELLREEENRRQGR